MRRPGSLDVGIYLRGVAVLARTPLLVVPIVATHLVIMLLFGPAMFAGGGMGLGGGFVASLIAQIVTGFGLGVTLVGADLAWRERPASLREMVEKARQRLGDIIWATFAYSFVLYAAQLLGSFVLGPFTLALGASSEWLVELLYAAAFFFVVYTMPAAVNGGVPGSAAVNTSFLQARAQPLPTALLTIVYVAANDLVPRFALPWVQEALYTPFPQLARYDIAFDLTQALLQGILATYAAVMLAKVYDGLATRRFFGY